MLLEEGDANNADSLKCEVFCHGQNNNGNLIRCGRKSSVNSSFRKWATSNDMIGECGRGGGCPVLIGMDIDSTLLSPCVAYKFKNQYLFLYCRHECFSNHLLRGFNVTQEG